MRGHDRRLRELESAAFDGDWSADQACRALRYFITSGMKEPRHPHILAITLHAGCAVLYGVEALAGKSPEQCSRADLHAAYAAGAAMLELDYIDDTPIAEQPPTPPSWRELEARLQAITPPPPPPPTVLPDLTYL